MRRILEPLTLKLFGAKPETLLSLLLIGLMSVITAIFFIVAALYIMGPRGFQWGLVP